MSLKNLYFGFKNKLNSNLNPHINLNNSKKIFVGNLLCDNVKNGYMLTKKETENKTKYIILRKESEEVIKNVIYYIHGGDYTNGLTTMYESFIYPLCDISDDIEVVLLDYSLAPEFKYPTQLNEALDVWNELINEFNSENIIIGSDSSGGSIALALIQKLKKEQNIAPIATFFISPWTDMTCSGKSYYTNYQKDTNIGDANSTLTEEKLEKLKNSERFSFIGDADKKDPYISPIFGDFTIFPKSHFIVGGDDMLLDDTLTIVKKIKENGNEITICNKEGMQHNFPLYLNFMPEGFEAFITIKDFIVDAFEGL